MNDIYVTMLRYLYFSHLLYEGACRYKPKEILVTENGVDVPGESAMTLQQALDDQFRIHFFSAYLDNAVQAVRTDGVPLTKYFVWSLLDNFEWVRRV